RRHGHDPAEPRERLGPVRARDAPGRLHARPRAHRAVRRSHADPRALDVRVPAHRPRRRAVTARTRLERDPLGTVEVPAEALYGAQTARAVANFPISGLRPDPAFVDAIVRIKRAAAVVHRGTGRLDAERADAILAAADAVLGGAHRDQFVVDVFQAGAGTSLHMNVNEVLATLATRALDGRAEVHPNDHVNMAQSTNDVIPTAIRLATLDRLRPGLASIDRLAATLRTRATDFDGFVKA